LASSETPPHSDADSKSNSYDKITLNISSFVCPKKGGLPESKIYMIIPTLQISIFSV
jgi:hypothetical protein